MTIRFEHPWWLLLSLAAIPLGVFAWRWLVSMSSLRRASAMLTRFVLLLLLSAMLAGASSVRRSAEMAVIVVADVSGSARRFVEPVSGTDGLMLGPIERMRAAIETASAGRGPDDLLGVVVFDGDAIAVAAPTRGGVVSRAFDLSSSEGTDIAGALELAAAMAPPNAATRIVLISDGNETRGDALSMARELAGGTVGGLNGGAGGVDSAVRSGRGRGAGSGVGVGGIAVDVSPLSYNVRRGVVLEGLDAPPAAPAGATVTLRAVLRSADQTRGTLRLLRDGEPVRIGEAGDTSTGRRIELRRGENVEFMNVELGGSGVHRFEAVFEPDDDEAGVVVVNNRASAFTLTPTAGSVLVIDGGEGGSDDGIDIGGRSDLLAAALSSVGLDVRVVPGSRMPADLLELQAFNLVILNDIAASELPSGADAVLAAYVTELGGGLVMSGGVNSFGPGGWKGTLIEPILPVLLDLPERLIRPDAAVVLVLDNSGSMRRSVMGSSRSQQDIANEGAALAVLSLDARDLVGVVVFNHESWELVRLGPNVDSQETARKVRGIRPGGGTNIPPALRIAMQRLSDVDADLKHVILLTDGISENQHQIPGIAQQMRDAGIRLTTIGVGDDIDSRSLFEAAEIGGGRYFPVLDPAMLPRVFLRAMNVVRTPMVREQPFVPIVPATGSPMVEGLIGIEGGIPALGGLTLTQRRVDATVVDAMLAPSAEGEALPLLSYWNAGVGRVGAFTSDTHRWASGWSDWPGYTRLWAQVARQLSRPQADRRQTFVTQISGGVLRIRLEARDDADEPIDGLRVPANVYAPDGTRSALRLVQTGPGEYEASMPAVLSGTYLVTATPRLGERALPPLLGGATRAAGEEFRMLRSNTGLLAEIAELTGGRVIDLDDPGAWNSSVLWDRSGVRPAEARTALWGPLLIWALVVLLLDVGTRRVAWDRWLDRENARQLRKSLATERGKAAQATLGSLRSRAERLDRAAASASAEVGLSRLSGADAERIVREQAARRRAERLARGRVADVAGGGSQRASSPGGDKQRGGQPAAADDDDGRVDLSEAKKRARDRLLRRERDGDGADGRDAGGTG